MEPRSYFPQLDALRAFAVLAVIWHHWFPGATFGLPLASGVQLFFVLSGFLITRILLVARDDVERTKATGKGRVIAAFWSRRILRIFPVFYAVVILAIIAGVADLRQSYGWHLSYASNFYFILQEGWHRPVAHFWTLAVEEQFYLVWPMVVLFLPRRWLPGVFVGLALIGPAYRACGVYFFSDVRLFVIGTPGSFDSLALGALLAWMHLYPRVWSRSLLSRGRMIALGAIALYIGLQMIPRAGAALQGIYGWSVLSVVFACGIHACTQGVGGVVGRVLNNGVLRYVGTISYGLYLVYNLSGVPGQLAARWFPQLAPTGDWGLATQAVVTLSIASASWHWFEKPINSLKRYLPYLHGPPSRQTSNEAFAGAGTAGAGASVPKRIRRRNATARV
jgi:peptidoglycan/LPS O-acetylase OafA/YrhL